jgi:hypothetical protein
MSCLHGHDEGYGCESIVRSQNGREPQDFHVPEPWSGDLANAPVLFLASNPSFWDKEWYPTISWTDDALVDFFHNRFGGGSREWIRDGTRTLLKGGEHSPKATKFFQGVRQRASELLCRPAVPGQDYALSEVVHCKSAGEEGVSEALLNCSSRYLDNVLMLSGARVIVVLGKVARDILPYSLDVPDFVANSMYGPLMIGGQERLIAFLPHSNARAPRTFLSSAWPTEHLAELRAFISDH